MGTAETTPHKFDRLIGALEKQSRSIDKKCEVDAKIVEELRMTRQEQLARFTRIEGLIVNGFSQMTYEHYLRIALFGLLFAGVWFLIEVSNNILARIQDYSDVTGKDFIGFVQFYISAVSAAIGGALGWVGKALYDNRKDKKQRNVEYGDKRT